MKILWNVVIVLSGLTELLAAATLIGGPEGIAAAGAGNMWSMHYGFAALAIASLSVWIWPRRRQADAIAVSLGVLLTFHIGLLIFTHACWRPTRRDGAPRSVGDAFPGSLL